MKRQVMKSEKGFSLIETLVALAVLGAIGVAVLGGLAMASKSTIISNEQTIAESLARSQIEYIQSQTYDSVINPPVYSVLSSLPSTYSIVTPMATRLDPKGDGTDNDDGLQKIAVTVKHGTKTVVTVEDYKVKR